MDVTHSKYPPSSAFRWLKCPASVLLEPDGIERDTTAADEGTLAHRICELKLTRDVWNDNEEELEECRANLLYKEEMEFYTDEYYKFIKNFDADPIVETKLDLSKYMPGLFGTCDCIAYEAYRNELQIVDFKYGFGKVEARENPQLRFYALGALDYILKNNPDINLKDIRITTTIFQPRIHHVDSETLTYQKLNSWYKSIKPAIKKITTQQVERNTGSWCKWCDRQIHCKEYQEELSNVYLNDFFSLSDDEIAQNYEKLKEIEPLIKKMREYLVKQLQNGSTVKGYKLQQVNSKSWTDKDAVTQIAKEHELVNTMSPSQAQRKLGKKQFEELLGDYVEIKPGSPKLVKEKG